MQSESTGRPQRSTALSTMTAILLANKPPPLKQVSWGSGANSKSTKSSLCKLSSPASLQPQPLKTMDGEEGKSGERGEWKEKGRGPHRSKAKSKSQAAAAGGEVNSEASDGREDDGEEENEEEEEGSEVGEERDMEEEEEEEEGRSDEEEDQEDADLTEEKKKMGIHGKLSGGDGRTGHSKRKGAKDKKGGKAVNIPSIEYPVRVNDRDYKTVKWVGVEKEEWEEVGIELLIIFKCCKFRIF